MAEKTNISWTNSTWNPVRGCERVSEGCRNCYAEVLAARHSYEGGWGEGLAKLVTRPDGTKEARWTGVLQTVEALLDAPLRWRKPRRVFANSMSDLFHEDVPAEFIATVFAVMAAAQRHTFQVLTKRPERMLALLSSPDFKQAVSNAVVELPGEWTWPKWPLPNVWLGVSAEDQAAADERIPLLLRIPAAVRWISAEPLLGSVDFNGRTVSIPWARGQAHGGRDYSPMLPMLDWVVVGGESGSDYRPMDMEHARSLIAQCAAAGVATFVKQDNGPRPGLKGRFTTEEWALKEFPA